MVFLGAALGVVIGFCLGGLHFRYFLDEAVLRNEVSNAMMDLANERLVLASRALDRALELVEVSVHPRGPREV